MFPQSTTLPGQDNDVYSYQFINQSDIVTEYGVDTPRRSSDTSLGPEWDSVYDYAGTGAHVTANETWEVLAWGYDMVGDGYLVVYEAGATENGTLTPGLDIMSRSEDGPCMETVDAIFRGLVQLGDAGLTELTHSTQKAAIDGRRGGMPPTPCDAACMNNTGPL